MKHWKWIAALVVAAGLFVAARFLPVAEWLTAFNQWAGQLGPLGYLLFIVVYVLATVLFAPGWVLTVGAGFTFGLLPGVVVVSIGSTLGAAAAFLIARFVAREQVERRTHANRKFRAIDRAIGEQGWKLILLLRLSPAIPFNLSNYFYGITAVKFWPYVLASWAGMLPGTLLYVYLGTIGRAGVQATAGTGERTTLEWIALALGLAATVVVTVWITRIARRALKRSDLDA